MNFPDQLSHIHDALRSGNTPSATVRQLLLWYGYERRGRSIAAKIRTSLDRLGLKTEPDFESAWIDGTIRFLLSSEDEAPSTAGIHSSSLELGESGGAASGEADPTYRVGKLDAANRRPVTVSPDAKLSEATTLLLLNDYSQLPVMTSEREVKGVISWKSIGSRKTFGVDGDPVREWMDQDVNIVDESDSLFRVIELVVSHDFVLVRKEDRRIGGIVTATDLGKTFYELGLPFLLLSEIENHIRLFLRDTFTPAQLASLRAPGDNSREVKDIADLTLGEIVRSLQDPKLWSETMLKRLDRTTFTQELELVVNIRNEVMHFDPDGIGNADLDRLRRCAHFFRQIHSVTKNGSTPPSISA